MPRSDAASRFQRQFAENLADSTALDGFGGLFDHLPAVYFFIKDAAGRFVRVNRPLLDVLGVAHERDVVGRTDRDLFAPELAASYLAEDREVMKARRTIAGRVWLVPDRHGMLRWFVSTKTPLFDRRGRPVGIAGAMQDVQTTGAVLAPYDRFGPVLRHVAEHYADRLRIDDLAALAHLSVSQFTRRFRSLFQITPARYLMRVRLNACCQLLASTDLDMATLAARTGFYDASHLVKQFRRTLGLTPAAYRARATRPSRTGPFDRA